MRKIVRYYYYQNEDGYPLYRKVRTDPKSFFVESFVKGAWVRGLKYEPTLYRLPMIKFLKKVYICEGEKDAQAMHIKRLWATTSGGAGTWRPGFSEYLKGKKVVVVPDNDKSGLRYLRDIAVSNMHAGIETYYVKLPVGKDVYDFFYKEKRSKKDFLKLEENKYNVKIETLQPYSKKNTDTEELSYPIWKLLDLPPNTVLTYCWNHEDTRPSLDIRNGFVYCYSCGYTADAVEIYRHLHNVDYETAYNEIKKLLKEGESV